VTRRGGARPSWLVVGVASALRLRIGEHADVEASFLGTSAAAIALGPRTADASLLAGAAGACLARRGLAWLATPFMQGFEAR